MKREKKLLIAIDGSHASMLRDGKIEFNSDFDKGLARAAHILAKHYTELARVAVREHHPKNAGHYLNSAAKLLERIKCFAANFADTELPHAMDQLGGDTILVVGKLIEGVGFTADEASRAVENVSAQVEKLGKIVAPEGNEIELPRRRSIKAVCVLHPIENSGVTGTVTFLERGGKVDITAKLSGLTSGSHGFDIDRFGDCCSIDMQHSGPDSPTRQFADLGHIVADQSGEAEYKRTDTVIQLRGTNSIIGRAVLVHAGEDDLTSQPPGNGEHCVACGVIGIAKPEP